MASDASCALRAIEKCGYLKIKRPPTSGKVRIKAWQSKYFVIRNVPPTFEYFKDELSYQSSRRTKEKNRINLENVIYIGTTNASRTQRNAFMIVDPHHGAIMLATDSEQETREWVDVLKRVSGKCGSEGESPSVARNQSPKFDSKPVHNPQESANNPPVGENSQGFPVTTRLTPSSEKIGIRDDYTMYITDEYVALYNVVTNALVVQWPIIGLRGWKSEAAESAGRRGTKLLTLEAGRKNETGEGLFQFFTSHGNQIANTIRIHSSMLLTYAISKRSKPSDSLEDLPHDEFDKKHKQLIKAATDPRPVSGHAKSILTRQYPLTQRAESDSFIFDKDERPNLSPASLRREWSLEKSTKELSHDDSRETGVESQMQSVDNMYLDLIGDVNANPVHIPDLDHRRRTSLDSSSLTSEEGVTIHKPSLNATNGVNDCVESYIDDSEINTCKKEKSKVDKNNKNNLIEQNSVAAIYSDPAKMKSVEVKKPVQSTPQLCADFLNQLSNPQAHQGSIFVHKGSLPIQETSSKNEQSSESRNNDDKVTQGKLSEGSSEHEDDIRNEKKDIDAANVNNQSKTSSSSIGLNKNSNSITQTKPFDNFDQTKGVEESPMSDLMSIPKTRSATNSLSLFPGQEGTMDLLEKVVSNLETPQAPTKKRLFPPTSKQFSHEHMEKNIPTKSEVPAEVTRHSPMAPKKTIEKSKSHCGFDSKQQAEKPPPLPIRPEMVAHARTKPSASLGDISKDLHRPIDVPKGIHRQLTPLGSFGAPSGPESVVSARILQRSTSGTSLGPVSESTVPHHSIHNSEKATRTETYTKARTRSLRGSGQENECIAEDDFESKKRRGSKPSNIFSKLFNTLNATDSKRRASCDFIPNGGLKDIDLKRGRSASINPGIVNEAWSPDHPDQSIDVLSPEESPKNFRSTELAARRASHDPNLDRRRNLFSSPTFENHRTREEMRQREKAMQRERERSWLPSEPPPRLPPRKKSDPPPIPPRLRKSSSDSSNSSSPNCKVVTQEQFSISTVESQTCTEDINPPPVPPRRDDRRGSQPPAIQLTTSSPEEKPLFTIGNPQESTCPSSNESALQSKPLTDDLFRSTQLHHQRLDTSISCPIPKRPPKSQELWKTQETLWDDDGKNIRYENTEITTATETRATEFSNFQRTESSFVSIEMQELVHSEKKVVTRQKTHEERLEIYDIERDSIDASTSDNTTSGPHSKHSSNAGSSCELSASVSADARNGRLSPQQCTGRVGRCSPGHTPPTLALNFSPRSGGIVLRDSPTTPIIA